MDTQEFKNDDQHQKGIYSRYKSLMRHSRDLVAEIDRDGVLVEMNPAGLKLLDCSEKEIVGYPLRESFRDDDALDMERKAAEAIESDSVIKFDWTIRPQVGPAKWLTVTAAPIEDDSQQTVAAVIIARDMTDMLTLDEDLAQAADMIASLRLRVKDALE